MQRELLCKTVHPGPLYNTVLQRTPHVYQRGLRLEWEAFWPMKCFLSNSLEKGNIKLLGALTPDRALPHRWPCSRQAKQGLLPSAGIERESCQV